VEPKASVVIPAHNEQAVIAANLRGLLDGMAPGEFDVVVVANACTDRTAEVARAAGVRVIETEVAGKPHAIRLGDAACQAFPRIYADADVGLTADGVRALVFALHTPGILAAGPVPRLDLDGVGPIARRVHRVHDRMVAPGRALAGVGVYALNQAGHSRAFPMPDVISDDGWVHNTFAPSERVVVPEAVSVVRPTRTVRAYLHRRLRVRAGNRQLAALGRPAPQGRLGPRALVTLVTTREVGPLDAGCYLAVLLLDKAAAAARRRRQVRWGSDSTTRLSSVDKRTGPPESAAS
jgi:glycosyltransferase involved in cell wall biosynthesis